MLTEAPMFAASLYYTDYRAHVHVFPPVEPPAELDRVDRFDEEFLAAAASSRSGWQTSSPRSISMHPTHWHMLQPVFLADLEPPMKVGIITPTTGRRREREAHVHDLALTLRRF